MCPIPTECPPTCFQQDRVAPPLLVRSQGELARSKAHALDRRPQHGVLRVRRPGLDARSTSGSRSGCRTARRRLGGGFAAGRCCRCTRAAGHRKRGRGSGVGSAVVVALLRRGRAGVIIAVLVLQNKRRPIGDVAAVTTPLASDCCLQQSKVHNTEAARPT